MISPRTCDKPTEIVIRYVICWLHISNQLTFYQQISTKVYINKKIILAECRHNQQSEKKGESVPGVTLTSVY